MLMISTYVQIVGSSKRRERKPAQDPPCPGRACRSLPRFDSNKTKQKPPPVASFSLITIMAAAVVDIRSEGELGGRTRGEERAIHFEKVAEYLPLGSLHCQTTL